ncbi:MAG: hypothetical protein SAK42_23215, partial [Oscillatoria sp. PMC 1076.18]|nr:hypothetical protein [Oscillatoria sp. PMC 1076.18]
MSVKLPEAIATSFILAEAAIAFLWKLGTLETIAKTSYPNLIWLRYMKLCRDVACNVSTESVS